MHYPPIGPRRRERLIRRIEKDFGGGATAFPEWYLRRAHFHPDGYLSEAAIRRYERLIAPLYAWPAGGSVRRYAAELVARNAGRVVEIGCGTGQLLEELARVVESSKLTGIDLSPYMLARAARRPGLQNVRLVQADATEGRGFGDEPFDVAILEHVLGHVPAQVADSIVENLEHALVRDGRLIVVDHTWHRESPRLGRMWLRSTRNFRMGAIAVREFALPRP